MDHRKSMHGDVGSIAKTQLWPDRLRALTLVAAALIFGLAAGAQASAAEREAAASKPFTICDDQTYALCFTSKCTMFNNVAYCTCDVEKGDSISLTQEFQGGDVCTFNAQVKRNGYMVSTWSAPASVLKPNGDQAVYNCAAETATGTYAQCDGGVCWKSTQGQKFPGLGKLDEAEIICSCPTVTADPSTAVLGYQIVGPYPCQDDFFKYCDSTTANTDNGSYLYVGAPTGSSTYLSKKLYGEVLPFNHCRRPTN
jgi:hypothetical protein